MESENEFEIQKKSFEWRYKVLLKRYKEKFVQMTDEEKQKFLSDLTKLLTEFDQFYKVSISSIPNEDSSIDDLLEKIYDIQYDVGINYPDIYDMSDLYRYTGDTSSSMKRFDDAYKIKDEMKMNSEIYLQIRNNLIRAGLDPALISVFEKHFHVIDTPAIARLSEKFYETYTMDDELKTHIEYLILFALEKGIRLQRVLIENLVEDESSELDDLLKENLDNIIDSIMKIKKYPIKPILDKIIIALKKFNTDEADSYIRQFQLVQQNYQYVVIPEDVDVQIRIALDNYEG